MKRESKQAHPVSFEALAIQFLARRDRTELQVKEFLTRKGASLHDTSEILKRLRARGYVDDVAFAFRWGTARLTRQPMGMKRLEDELCAQGIDRLPAKDAIERIFDGRTELELAQTLLGRRSCLGGRGDASKNLSLLRRYGFSEETIDCAITLLGEPECRLRHCLWMGRTGVLWS